MDGKINLIKNLKIVLANSFALYLKAETSSKTSARKRPSKNPCNV